MQRPTALLPSRLSLAVPVAALLAAGCSSQGQENCAGLEQGVKVCAKGATLTGIDVSYYQGVVDWAKVKGAGQAFGIARISDGLKTPDTQFARNWMGIKAAGLVRGSYQFFRASADPVQQADLVVSSIQAAGGLEPGDLPPALDLEVTDGQTAAVVVQAAQAWLDRIEQQLGRRAIIYTGNNMATVTQNYFSKYPLWIPNYTTQCPSIPSGWTDWIIWQNSGSGTVAGVQGMVDTDVFNGDAAALAAFIQSTQVSMSSPPDMLTPPPDDGGVTPTPTDDAGTTTTPCPK